MFQRNVLPPYVLIPICRFHDAALEEKVSFIVILIRTANILDNFVIPVKGISFFGPKSEYIVSGSDCGNIYFWDKGTESIVQWLVGDENGVVRIIVPGPLVILHVVASH